MRKRLCNRCETRYRPTHGGKLKLSGGETKVEANLCAQCHEDILEAYQESV